MQDEGAEGEEVDESGAEEDVGHGAGVRCVDATIRGLVVPGGGGKCGGRLGGHDADGRFCSVAVEDGALDEIGAEVSKDGGGAGRYYERAIEIQKRGGFGFDKGMNV